MGQEGNFSEAISHLKLAMEQEPDNIRVEQWLEKSLVCIKIRKGESCNDNFLYPPPFSAFSKDALSVK